MKSGNGTYSFIDVKASITGPGGSFSLCGDSEGVAEEGIRIEPVDSKNTMTMGAVGGMHNLHANNPATVTLVLLKNSPVNQQLMDMYNAQRVSSATWGKNTIVRPIAQLAIRAQYNSRLFIPPLQFKTKKMVEPILGFLMQELLKINWENIANERSSN